MMAKMSGDCVTNPWWKRLNYVMAAKGEIGASAEEAFDVSFLPPREAAQALSNDRKVLGHRPPLTAIR